MQENNVALKTIELFKKYFSGNVEAYGEYIPSKDNVEGRKQEGTCQTIEGHVSKNLFSQHLQGVKGLGIIPIMRDNTCRWSVIDIDTYNQVQMNIIIKTIYNNSFPLLPFRSKSGGLHLYIFWKDPVTARESRMILARFRSLLGLPPKTEIFPKQNTLSGYKTGSWLNLPYFGNKTQRYLYDKDCRPCLLSEAFNHITHAMTTIEDATAFFDILPLSDAPPCLQTIFLKGSTEARNNYLFSLAVFYKNKYGEEDFGEHIKKANSSLDEPLDEKELEKTIITSVKSNTYSYKCQDSPINSICNKKLCAERIFGIGDMSISNLSFKQLTKHVTLLDDETQEDEVYWEWVINDKKMYIPDASFFNDQTKLINLCIKYLDMMPYRVKKDTWNEIVNTALKNKIIENNTGDGVSSTVLLLEYLSEYIHRDLKDDKEHLLFDHSYIDEEKGAYVFKMTRFLEFLRDAKNFKKLSDKEVFYKLKSRNGRSERMYINKENSAIRVWKVPISLLEKYAPTTYPERDFSPEDVLEDEDF